MKEERQWITRDKGPARTWERALSRVMLGCENVIKVPVFGCQRCGECILSHTAFICCQKCPKRMRNGPCGGTRPDGHCEVYPERFCVWFRIHRRAKLLHRSEFLYPMENLHNWKLEKTSAWLNVFLRRIRPPSLFRCRKERNEF